MASCRCGCGEVVTKGCTYRHGHNSRVNHPMAGRKLPKEAIERLRAARIGKKPWIAGRKHSDAAKKKMSDSHRGQRPWMIGRTHTKETCAKMSASHKGVPLSESHKKNIGLASIGTPGAPLGGVSPFKGRKHTKEVKRASSERVKKWWKDPENAKRCLVINSPNKQELELMSILEDLYPGEWKFVGNGQVIIDGKCPDFININGKKKIIEFYGYRWHKDDDPQDRIDIFTPYGYETLIIWTKHLQSKKVLIPMLKEFCED